MTSKTAIVTALLVVALGLPAPGLAAPIPEYFRDGSDEFMCLNATPPGSGPTTVFVQVNFDQQSFGGIPLNRADALFALAVGESFVGQADGRVFGTGTVSHTVSGLHFTGFEMSYPDLWNTDEFGARSCGVPSCMLVAPVLLPAGALITHIALNAWDLNAQKDATVVLKQNYLNGLPSIVLATAATTLTPRYALITTVLGPAHTVDNRTSTYALIYTGADDESTKVHAVRIFYKLQTSPPPGAATFADVPTNHPFFAFVAMVAAGGDDRVRAGAILPQCAADTRPDGGVPEPGAGPALRALTS